MEALNDAINASKKVSFQYFTYNVRKEQKLKYDGYTYVFSPYKLIWNGDYYYVVGYSEKHKGIGNFRVDRIVRCPIILNDDAVQPPKRRREYIGFYGWNDRRTTGNARVPES